MTRNEGFDRERFLLHTVAGVFIAPFTLNAIAMAACINLSLKQLPRQACTNFAERRQDTFETALGTSLALLGGSSIAAARRWDPNRSSRACHQAMGSTRTHQHGPRAHEQRPVLQGSEALATIDCSGIRHDSRLDSGVSGCERQATAKPPQRCKTLRHTLVWTLEGAPAPERRTPQRSVQPRA